MQSEYALSIAIDVLSLFCCVALLLRFGRLRFSHPATPYLFSHLNIVTFRLFALAGGAKALFAGTLGAFDPVESFEIVRAALYWDIALWIVTLVWSATDNDFEERPPTGAELMINPRILRVFVPIFMIISLFGFRFIAIPGVLDYQGAGDSEWGASSYLYILPTWFGLALLAHIYYYGANRITGTLMALSVTIIALQGGFRFRSIVTCLMLVHIWVERRHRRWPSLALFGGLAFLAVLFFPLKELGIKVQKGAALNDLSDTISSSVTEVLDGRAADQAFLDECASVITLCDQRGEHNYGRGYLPLLTLPIPRVWWADKPTLMETSYVNFVSTKRRPMARCGMIGTYIGEAYVDFGLVGVVFAPFLLAFGFSWAARKALRAPYHSIRRFAYAMLSVNLIQVFRDGFFSIIMFTFVNMMPLVILILVHVGARFLRARQLHATLMPTPPGTLPS